MASRTLPGLGLKGFWGLGFDGWDTENDANLRMLSVYVYAKVKSRVAAEPGSPANGDIHLLTGTANANKLAVRDNGAWVYLSAWAGYTIFVEDEAVRYKYDGAAWAVSLDSYSDEQAQDAVAALLAAGTHTGITFTYDDATGALSAAVVGNSDYEESVRIATTVTDGNITLFGTYTLQAVALADGDRILPTAQTAGADNIVWIVRDSAAWEPAVGWSGTDTVTAGHIVPVDEGSNAGQIFQLTTSGPITIGATALTWTSNAKNTISNFKNKNVNTAAYTIVTNNRKTWLFLGRAGAQTVTIPTHATAPMGIGSEIIPMMKGTGTKTITAAAGVKLNGVTAGSVTISTPGDAYFLKKLAQNEWWAVPMKDPAAGTYGDEQAMDAIAAMFAAGTHTGITFTYDDALNKMSVVVTGGYTDEQAQDALAAAFAAGSHTGITITYDDAANKFNFASTITQYTDEMAQDAIAALFAAGSHTGITFTYDDATNKMTATVSGGYTDEQAMDAIAAMIAAGTHKGVTITYDDATNKISFEVPNVVLAAYISGTISTSTVLWRFSAAESFTLPASLTSSYARLVTAPSGGSVAFTIKKNGSSVGSIDFASGSSTPTFTFASAVSLAAGDYLDIESPSNVYGASGLNWTLKGAR